MRKSARWLFSLFVSALALWFVFRDTHLSALMDALRQANYWLIAPWFVLTTVAVAARAQSWRTLLHPVRFLPAFHALNAGQLLNNLLPFRVGEIARAYLVSRDQKISAPAALSSIVVSRVIELVIVGGLLLAFLPVIAGLAWASNAVLASFVVMGVALAGLVVLIRSRALALRALDGLLARAQEGWKIRVEKFLEGLSVLENARLAITATIWGVVAWILTALGTWVLLIGFVGGADLSMGFFVTLIAALGVALPSAPGGLGVLEAATVAALAVFGVQGETAVSFAVAQRALNFGLSVLLGGIGMAQMGENLKHLSRTAQALVSDPSQTELRESR